MFVVTFYCHDYESVILFVLIQCDCHWCHLKTTYLLTYLLTLLLTNFLFDYVSLVLINLLHLYHLHCHHPSHLQSFIVS